MAILSIPEKQLTIRDPQEIKRFFHERNLFFDQWTCAITFNDSATQDEILQAYAKDLEPFMKNGGYQTADVISINHLTENYDAIRTKFLAEHTHSEDEIRFFVDGQGLFWFHLENEPVFNLLCEKGDLISVPAGTKHWFDAGATHPFIKAIRIFIDMSGWVPEYTQSTIEQSFETFQVPLQHEVNYILTDIEGTTSSIHFVYDELFPYFRKNIDLLKEMGHLPFVQEAFEQTVQLAENLDNEKISGTDEIIAKITQWSNEDKKITPLKTLQGILWEAGYASGELKGHIYEDVAPFFDFCRFKNIQLGVFSSGSVHAQKLLFGHSLSGDLTPCFSHYFDTKTGGKREAVTYTQIASEIGIPAKNILFLSDIVEELEAAHAVGMQTIQLVRSKETQQNWNRWVSNFNDIKKMIHK